MSAYVKPTDGLEYKQIVFDPHSFTYSSDDKVCIIDGDGSPNFPNLALQKISAWEKRNNVKNVSLIKLKHRRVKGVLRIDEESLKQLNEVINFDRVYASFIFTRSKSIIEQLSHLGIKNLFIGGTGSDEYFEMLPTDKRAKPKRITQLHELIENMYPDHTLYESESADANISFWSNTSAHHVVKKYKKEAEDYLIPPADVFYETCESQDDHNVIVRFEKFWNNNGYADGKTYRGSTRGNGYSSKGCPRKCTFCVVPIIQGDIQPMYYGLLGVINWVLPIGFYPTMSEIIVLYKQKKLFMRPHVFFDPKGKVERISPFLTISDNNFPADPTCLEKMDYMIQNNIAVNLNQGMDARLLTAKERYDSCGTRYPSGDEICQRLSKLYFINFTGTSRQMHFSWDYIGVGRIVIEGLKKLVEQYGLRYSNFTVYCLSGFNTSFDEDYLRVMTLKKLKVDPYIMLFRNVDGSEGTKIDGSPQDWRLKHLTRWVNNKIIFRVTPFEKYDMYLKELSARNNSQDVDDLNQTASLECFDWLTQEYIKFA